MAERTLALFDAAVARDFRRCTLTRPLLEAAAGATARRDVASSDPERRQLSAAWHVARGA